MLVPINLLHAYLTFIVQCCVGCVLISFKRHHANDCILATKRLWLRQHTIVWATYNARGHKTVCPVTHLCQWPPHGRYGRLGLRRVLELLFYLSLLILSIMSPVLHHKQCFQLRLEASWSGSFLEYGHSSEDCITPWCQLWV